MSQPGQPEPSGPPPEWPPRAADDFIDAPAGPAVDVFPPLGAFADEQPPGADAAHQPPAHQPPGAEPPGADAAYRPPTSDAAYHAPGADTAEQPTVPPGHQDRQDAIHEPTQVIPTLPDSGASAAQPWHAQHEAAGQWQYPPPEHPAWQHSPAAETVVRAEPIWSGPPAEPRRRRALWISLALSATLLLCGGGAVSAYFLLRDAGTPGSPDPATAVDQFLTAVYSQQDAKSAEQYVCREARDKTKLTDRVTEIKTYASGYTDPVFRWGAVAVSEQSSDRATVSVQLTMSTSDEKAAAQQLRFIVVHKTGWLVCEVSG